ncbi:MAG: helix-turn-helix domain-containing protein [Nitrospirae bacterium]|nr:helix-turn-helix domain-containing protein [Nitrospirota bacterium]
MSLLKREEPSEPGHIFWDIKAIARYLAIKPSTLYAWVAQGKIPYIKIHGLIRFQPAEIEAWITTFQKKGENGRRLDLSKTFWRTGKNHDVDALIAKAKQQVYDAPHGETGPTSSPSRKEGKHGAR